MLMERVILVCVKAACASLKLLGCMSYHELILFSVLFYYYYTLKGGGKLNLPVVECDRVHAAASAVLDHSVASLPSTSLATGNGEQCPPDSPTTPVTITHFQQSETGNLEKKTVPESNNPFVCPTPSVASPAVKAISSKNPFATETNSSNPFLLRLASPRLGNRASAQPIASEAAPSSELAVAPSSSVIFFSCYVFLRCEFFLMSLVPALTFD